MITITVANSYSKISGWSMDQFKAIRKVLSYRISATKRHFIGAHRSPIRYLIDRQGVFPSGLMYLVKRWASKTHIAPCIRDTRNRLFDSQPSISATLPYTPYPKQLEAAEVAVKRGQGTIQAPTGYGKSLMMALIIDKLKLRTLIVVTTLGLKQQLTESMRKIFGNLDYITIENIDSPELPKLTNFDILIVDEAHHGAAVTYRRLNRTAWKGIFYRFCFTATPWRTKTEEQMLFESLAGEVIYQVTYQQAVEAGAIVPVEAYYIELPTIDCQGTTWAEVYSTLVVNREDRNKIISDLVDSLFYSGTPTLCLTKEITHGFKIQEKCHSIVDFMKGENLDNRIKVLEFNLGEIKSLIATAGVCGEGIDLKPCEYCIIAGLGRSRIAFMQNVGRAVRKYPGKESGKIIIFKDSSHRWTLTHFKEQCKILREEYGCEPVKLEV